MWGPQEKKVHIWWKTTLKNCVFLRGLIKSVRAAEVMDRCRPLGAGVWTLEDKAALGCEEMMHADSGYSRADRLEETLIDPENRDACGRNVTEPGTDVEQSSRNAAAAKVGRPGEITDSFNAVASWEPSSFQRYQSGRKSVKGPQGSTHIEGKKNASIC